MKQKTAIFLAMALTVFVLVMSAAVVMQITTKVQAQANIADAPTAAVENISAKETDTPTTLPSATSTQTSLPTNTATQTATTISILNIDRATQIALGVFPNSRTKRTPELVNYKGKMAYEVLLNRGTVYVDAFDGTVLAHFAVVIPKPTATVVPTTVPPPPTTDPNAGNTGGGGGGGGGGGDNSNPAPSTGGVQAPPIPPATGGGGGGSHDGKGEHEGGKHGGGGHDD